MSSTLDSVLDAATGDLVALSHAVHARPELAFEEHFASAATADLLAGGGFEVRRGVAGLPTAFDATYGSGELVVAVCAEYDALPEIGHACGHNIIAASAVGAGLALASVADELGLTVRVLGTPAEESGGGKVLMLDAGVFDDVSLAMMVHPGPFDIAAARSLALSDIAVRYAGREAHASAAPEWGINAGDAVTVAQVGVGLLRQHLRPGQQIHGIVGHAGTAPNIVPGSAEMFYYLRADTAEALADLDRRARGCFEAGAVATGCTHEIVTVSPTYTELTPDPWLVAEYRRAAATLGRALVPEEFETSRPFGSTDMGNVTARIPGIHPVIGLDSGGAVTHQPGFTTACITESADRAVVDGARALARVAVAAATDPQQRSRLVEGTHERTVRR
ncbi:MULTISPECIES: M20 family metallopeptidase [unclassified Rhodococcus (in: high G+C Gram-positive bacteria)]|uniref:M20 family metallopeptidase n=1 Tax=unclassified Rhodococcus (in: high G+C Gram-positive bacteria) TaxID=192944 RepID=UPI0006F5BFD3|nr:MULTISPECIES: M20 family metallopeptidase [unclassified Rhodococcus (in: high G+C Gram-positive bacteria)]KQU31182.1 peptidase M20 [Rhodococcus sp. Leaf225]KQU41436.1 peptidase M20 [Rhodococcus sp. Leaf258]